VILGLLAIGTLALASIDMWFTKRRVLKYGAVVELNPGLKRDAELGQLDVALLRRILLPNIAGIALLVFFGWQTPLAIFFGVRATIAYFQFVGLSLEKKFDELLKKPGA
jgi:hypothetical protein